MAVGDSQRYPKVDFEGSKRQFGRVVRNMTNVYDLTPEAHESGRNWYPKVHDIITKETKRSGLTHRQGSGLVAATSPNADFENSNIHAIGELKGLKRADWDVIHRSSRNISPRTGRPTRTGEARSVLQGMALSRVPDSNLVKAHRILEGEEPTEVMPRQTSPKTHAFFHNLEYPDKETHVTIDGRQHDIGNNRMYPWEYSGRGISSAGVKSGKPTRYEHFENAVRAAAESRDVALPHTFQAMTWEGGKLLERGGDPTRSKGAVRVGQPYYRPGRGR